MACCLARRSGHVRPQHYGGAVGAGGTAGHLRRHGARRHTSCLQCATYCTILSVLVLGYEPHLDHLQVVDVQAVNSVPAARSATVEPADVDDWEVVESNAEYLTDNMLNQVPVFINASAIAACCKSPNDHRLSGCPDA